MGRAEQQPGEQSAEFPCHLDPGDPFTSLPSAAKIQRAEIPLLTQGHERKSCNKNEWRSDW